MAHRLHTSPNGDIRVCVKVTLLPPLRSLVFDEEVTATIPYFLFTPPCLLLKLHLQTLLVPRLSLSSDSCGTAVKL